jgi:hypothetical protein
MQVFTFGDKTIVVDEAQLEAIRKAVVARLATEDDDIYRSLKKELEQSIAVVSPEDTRLGAWVLTVRDNQSALIRIPPRSAVNYIFVAKLARDYEGRWVVTDLFDERMMAR